MTTIMDGDTGNYSYRLCANDTSIKAQALWEPLAGLRELPSELINSFLQPFPAGLMRLLLHAPFKTNMHACIRTQRDEHTHTRTHTSLSACISPRLGPAVCKALEFVVPSSLRLYILHSRTCTHTLITQTDTQTYMHLHAHAHAHTHACTHTHT